MLSMQHVLCAELHDSSPEITDSNYIASLVLPDAIRAYSGPRQYSHFEKGSYGSNDTSWWQFPTDMKGLTKEKVQANLSVFAHLSKDVAPCAIGEDTDIHAFYEHNQHLPETMFTGIEDHLQQDIEFDRFIREKIDCSRKYEDEFVFQGKTYDGKGIRDVIGQIEQQGIYVLAHELYQSKGITANQQWFQDKIKPMLEKEYPEDLAEKTFSFMKMSRSVDMLITSHDWSYLDKGILPYRDYQNLYSDVLHEMDNDFDFTPEGQDMEYE